MRGLYPIVDLGTLRRRNLNAIAFARAVLTVRPPFLQLRAKGFDDRDAIPILRELRTLCKSAGTQLVANDHVEWALLAGADFVHIGQDDAPLEDVRKIAPSIGIGISTHSIEQLTRVIEQRPDYVAYGPIFATVSKENPDTVVGIDGLREAHAIATRAGIPLVAIGGIDLHRASSIKNFASCAAVIAALLPDLDAKDPWAMISDRAHALHAALTVHA